MTVETCRRSKLVCSSWYKAFSACDPCKKIREFELLFRPMFERFVCAVSVIDPKATKPKFAFVISNLISIPHENYLRARFECSLSSAKIGCGIVCEETGNNVTSLMNNKRDKSRIISACDTLFEHFYKKGPVSKIYDTDYVKRSESFENKFAKMTIGQLCGEIEEADDRSINAYKDAVTVIKAHNLLPIESRELLKRTGGCWSMPASIFWGICILVGLVLGDIWLLIWIFNTIK